jgi:hypothetical protein
MIELKLTEAQAETLGYALSKAKRCEEDLANLAASPDYMASKRAIADRIEELRILLDRAAPVIPEAVPIAKPEPEAPAPAPVKAFEIGKTYETRSICDYDCIYSFTILARTAKTVTVEVHGKTVKRGIKVWDGVEYFKPFGSYSMSATIRASKEIA